MVRDWVLRGMVFHLNLNGCSSCALVGHYLNLPVMNDGGEIVGMVDVLKLTYATLEQVSLEMINAMLTE